MAQEAVGAEPRWFAYRRMSVQEPPHDGVSLAVQVEREQGSGQSIDQYADLLPGHAPAFCAVGEFAACPGDSGLQAEPTQHLILVERMRIAV